MYSSILERVKKNERTTEYFNGLEGVNSGREVQGKIKALHN